jgi:2-oxoisovalerate dehydrogenase E2 component (dihydrolipoyl transacylase)
VASLKQFKLPDVGEGLTEAEVSRWHVKPGDAVTQNQPICEIETAKALVELPSPFAGVVSELLVPEGTTVDVGTPLITIDVSATGDAERAEAEPAAEAGAATEPAGATESAGEPTPEPTPEKAPAPAEAPSEGGRTSVLVGYGPRAEAPARRRPRHAPPPPAPPVHSWPSVAPIPAPNGVESPVEVEVEHAPVVLAKPPVRKLARDLGIDLATVHGSGPDGIVTRADVEAAADAGAVGRVAAPMPRGGEERIPVHGVRKATAAAMTASAFTIPHVTEFVTIDVTNSMNTVERLRELPEFSDVKVTPLLLVAKAVLLGIERYPMINSVWDDRHEEIVVRHYVNLGIAAATPRGLVVPNIKHAEALSLPKLGRSLNALATTAREGRTSVADMQHGTFTITNVGVFGIDTGTPIINPGEAAILAFGAVREQPWVHRGRVRPRWATTLALSFDHRIIDGELGSRFLRDVANFLEDPGASLLARL